MRLSRKFALRISILAAVFGVGAIAMVALVLEAQSRLNEHRLVDILANSLAEPLALDVINGDAVRAQRHLRAIEERTEEIAYLYLIGFSGEVFAHTFGRGFPKGLAPQGLEHQSPSSRKIVLEGKGEVLEVFHPLIEGMDAGLYIGIDLRFTNHLLLRLLLLITGLLILLAVGGGVLSYFVGRRLTKPLETLAVRMSEYGEGKWQGPLGEGAETAEEKILVDSFNRMVAERSRQDENLRESEAKYRDLVETSPFLIWKLDREGMFTYLNAAWEKALGYQVEEMLGRKFLNFKPGWTHVHSIDGYRQVIAGGTLNDLRTVYLTKNGEERAFTLRAKPLLDAEGRFVGSGGTAVDITEQEKAQAELQRSRDLLSQFIDSSSDYFAIFDKYFNILDVDNKMAAMMGLSSKEELIGKNVLSISPEMEHNGLLDLQKQVMETGEAQTVEEVVAHPQAGEQWISVKIFKVGEGIGTITANITGVKKAEQARRESEERVRLLLDSTTEAIYGVDLERRCTFVNPACLKLLGYDSVEELLGRDMHDVMHHTYRDGTPYPHLECSLGAAIQAEESCHDDSEVYWRKDGSSFAVEYWASPIRREGRVIGSVVAFLDITEKRKADRAKAEFISTVSHELRTPLTSIKGALGLHRAGVVASEEEGRSLLDVAYANVEQLEHLINDILDVDKMASGKMDFSPEPLELEPLVMQAVEANRSYGDLLGVKFKTGKIPSGLVVQGDRERLMQVFANLLSNAAKFSPEGGKVKITLAQQGGSARISVADEGMGIPESFRERVFDRFSQADSSDTRSKGGTGLGLNITKTIVEIHGGEIGFTTETGKGTTFYFDLPLFPQTRRPSLPVLPAKGPGLAGDDRP